MKYFAALWLALVSGTSFAQCVSLTTLGSAYTQNFDTLANTAGSTTNNLTLTGWFLTESGSGARDNEQYAVDTGGSNTGDTYSYGAAGNADRALGGLQSGTLIPIVGACFTNNTGTTITALDIAYTGEQWRISNTAAARDDRLEFQYSTNATSLDTGGWTGVALLNFVNPIKTAGTASALDGNAAANRTAVVSTVPAFSIANGATFWLRWNDINASGADDGLALDNFSLTPQGGIPLPALSIGNAALAEGDAGVTVFSFQVTLSAPAGPGGVTFDIATADGTAQDDNPATEDNDYVAQILTGQSIPAGSTGPYNFNVTVNGDGLPEPDETFFVNVTNVTGATVTDGQGQGTLQNDDVTVTPIHDVQGPGSSSPIVGASVTIQGVVTGVATDGFFVQTPDAAVDADPATSQGLFVFTGAAPPASAAVGNLVRVTGTVAEFVPPADPLQPPLTELTSPTVVLMSSGHPLPTAIPLTPTFPDPAGPHDQLERTEGMRVALASFTVTGATGGAVSEAAATAASNGLLHGTVSGVPRPFREPGIPAPDPAEVGSIPPIPRFDANPEVLAVDSDGLVPGAPLDVAAGAVLTNLVGPLDYRARRYTVLPETAPTVTDNFAPSAVAARGVGEVTLASWSLQRFFDTTDDASVGDIILTPAAFDRRLAKASLAIREQLRTPDIVALNEVENLATLQALAARISSDAIAASQPDPAYVAYLVEGNDTQGLDSGFLVATAEVAAGVPRVAVDVVQQESAATLFVNPDSSTAQLHARPPLRLNARVNFAGGAQFALTAIAVDLATRDGLSDGGPGTNGWPTLGARRRALRQRQAEDVANLVQSRQTADPAERIAVLGSFHAYEFNDGHADVTNVVAGTPPPDNTTMVAGDGVDLVNPDLDNLVDTLPAAQRYDTSERGDAFSLGHVLVNPALVAASSARRIEHARFAADAPETARAGSDVLRAGARDPLVAYIAAFAVADLGIALADAPDPVAAGADYDYTVTLSNAGPDTAQNAQFSLPLPANATFEGLTAPAGWICTTPAVGAGGTVACSQAAMAVGSAVFTVTARPDPSLPVATVLTATATAASASLDPAAGNASATTSTTVNRRADIQVTVADAPDPALPGGTIDYTITLDQFGPSDAQLTGLQANLPGGTTFVSLTHGAEWTCSTPAVGSGGSIACSLANFEPNVTTVLTLRVALDSAAVPGSVVQFSANASSPAPDPVVDNNAGIVTTTVAAASADLSVALSDAPDPVAPGTALTYTLVANNAGPSAGSDVVLSNPLPPGTTFASLSAAAGWSCSTPAVGAGGSVTCGIASFAPGSASFTLVVNVPAATAVGSVLTDSANLTASSSDPNPGNGSATASTTVGSGSADLAVTSSDAPDPVTAGTQVVFTDVLTNAGPSSATDASVTQALPAGLGFAAVTAPAGFACTTPAVGASGNVVCTAAAFAPGNATITVTATVAPDASGPLVASASAASATLDPNPDNNTAATSTAVVAAADLGVSIADAPDPVAPAGTLSYTIVLSNAGPSAAANAAVSGTLPAALRFASLTAPAGFTCSTPAPGAAGAFSCSTASFGAGNATFTLSATVDPAAPVGSSIVTAIARSTTTADANAANDTASATTTVGSGSAGLSLTKIANVANAAPGANIAYTLVASNAGPANATTTVLTDALPANTTFVSLAAPAGFTCTTPAVGANGTVTCTQASFAPGNASFTLVAQIAASAAGGSALTNTATVSSATADPSPADNSASAVVNVLAPATLRGSKTVSGSGAPGSALTYAIVLSNQGAAAQGDNPGDEFVDVLPANTALVSAIASSGTATADLATDTVRWNGAIAAGATVTITIQATVVGTAPVGSAIVNQGTIAFDADGNGSNEANAVTDDPGTAAAGDGTGFVVSQGVAGGTAPITIPAGSWGTQLMLGLMVLIAGGVLLRRR